MNAVVTNEVGDVLPGESGWHAELALRFEQRGTRTALVSRKQFGPLLVQRPFYPESGGVCHVYLLHPPAGIVGGDDLSVLLDLESGTHALITTPAATRWYFSRRIEARARQHAAVADGATLEWLPQETLIFDGAHARLTTRIDLVGSAQFCGWEVLGLGRPACGEQFSSGALDFRFELYRDGEPLILERLRSARDGCPGLHGNAACATFMVTGADDAILTVTRDVLATSSGALCAATLIDDVLVVRGLAPQCEPLKNALLNVWSAVRPLVSDLIAVPPRIWHT